MKNKILGSLILVGLLAGCGSGGSTGGQSPIDNSKNTELKNDYGYYGDKVIFGNHQVTGDWVTVGQFNPGEYFPSLGIELYGDGTAYTTDRTTIAGIYGVSKDGTILKLSEISNDIRILSKKKITKDNHSIDCYNIDYGSTTVNIICPMEFNDFYEKFGKGAL